jgi:uncharacterized protein (UPF0332 family)
VSSEVSDLWQRAGQALQSARLLAVSDPDAAASRAYYCAYYAVSAIFLALEGRAFTKHTALEAAVHRDLVKPGLWSIELGAAFSWLVG